MKIVKKISIAVAAAALIAGCGGSGGPGTGGAALSRQRVMDLFARGIGKATGQPGLNDGRGRGKTRSHEEWDTYYDDQLQLWAVFDHDEPVTGDIYYVDAELTQPAGHDLITTDFGPPRVEDRNVKYDAGALAGQRHTERRTLNDDASGSAQGTGHFPNEGDYTYSMQWRADGLVTSWTEKFTYTDGTWDNFTSQENEGGTRTLTWSNSAGITFTMNFQPDFSGTGTITGNASGLPATLQWDANGAGFIRWSDGSQTDFTDWAF
jgi:hypothetical protein